MGAKKNVARWLRDSLIILISALVLGLVVELGTRVAIRLKSHSWPVTTAARFDTEIRRLLRLYRRHPYLNTAPREGMSAAAFGKQASFNSLGYRSPERPREKPPGSVRIVCSGGSTTFDILSVDDSKTWPWQMEGMLRELGLDAEVFNAGFPGWTSLENLSSLAIRDVDLRPDIVVLFQGVNDLQPASHQPFDRQYERGHAEQTVRALGFELQPLKWYEHSLFVEKSRDLIVGKRDPWQRVQVLPSSHDRRVELPPEAIQTFERNIRSFIAVATAAGAQVLLATQPIRIRGRFGEADRAYLAQWILGLDPVVVPEQLERLNTVLRDLTEEGPAVLADVATDVAWQDSDFSDPMHFSARGSSLMARFMADAVKSVSVGRGGAESGPGPSRSAR